MARDGLLEQLHLLAHQLGAEIAHARDVAAGPGKAGHEAYGHGIGWVDRDNGNGTSAMLGGEGGFRGDHDDDIDLEPNQLGYELRQPLGPEFGRFGDDGDVLPFDPVVVLQAFPKCSGDGREAEREVPDRVHLPCLLRLGGERRCHEAAGDHRHEGAPLHHRMPSLDQQQSRLEALEGLRGRGHLQAEPRHEDEIGVSAEGEQPVAIEGAEGGDALGVEARFLERRLGIGEVALAEGVVRLEAIEATVEQVAGGGREGVVEGHATGQVTTALPWCQEGS